MFSGYESELLADLRVRWKRIQCDLTKAGADAILLAMNMNLFYVSGRVYSGFAYVARNEDPIFFVRRPAGLSGDRTYSIRRMEEIPSLLASHGIPSPHRLMLEDGEIPHIEWLRFSEAFPDAEIVAGGSHLMRMRRAVKTPWEVKQVEAGGALQAAAFADFPALFRPGMTDQEFNIAMFAEMLRRGNLGVIRASGYTMENFVGSVLVGENGGGASPFDFALGGSGWCRALPVGQCGVVIRPGDAVMCDIPGNLNGYMSDCTRTFSYGSLVPRAYEAHQCSIEIESAIAAAGVPGASCEALYLMSLEMAEKAGFSDCFMGSKQKAKFVGHGTGIYVNELPVLCKRSPDVLEEGMVIAVEPKFVIEGAGAVGVEDTYVVTPNGLRCLSESPRGIVDLATGERT
ncbi:MAG: aminopeptidase P family protein [Kiritimatiellae bacterium]|nr:aminopeptidase P family protein [Kiritimatiellia bacterium]